MQVFNYPALGAPVVVKKSFHSDSVAVEWNATGSAFLMQVSVEVDNINQSYYGRTGLHFVRLDKKMDRTPRPLLSLTHSLTLTDPRQSA